MYSASLWTLSIEETRNATTIRVTFNEDVVNLSTDDFVVNATPASTATVTGLLQQDAQTYDVTVSNLLTGCEVVEEIELPGFPPITANFGLSPNGRCLSSLEPIVDILDFSVGGTRGWWNFGDSTVQDRYVLGENPRHEYEEPGEYIIQLELENDGGCTSVHEEVLCILPEYRLFAPNAFSPNYDGQNDFFQFKGESIAAIEWQVFNRYGQILYTGSGMEDRWDGVYKGLRVRAGVYTFVAEYRTIYDNNPQILKGFITVVY